jgi:hypothetical protein
MSDAADGAAPVGPVVPPGDDKDLTMIAPPKAAKAKKAPKGKSGKAAKGGKGAKGKRGAPTIASHPKAHAQIRRAKGWGGLGGFAIAAYLSYQAQVPFDQLGLRAIAAGIAGYLVAWAFMVTLWRYLLLAEMQAFAERQRAAAAAAAQASIPAQAPQGGAPPGGRS